jgi:hypothetical protein
VQRRIFAAQSAAIDNIQGVVDRLNAGLVAIREMQTEMLPLFESLNDLDDTVEGAGE